MSVQWQATIDEDLCSNCEVGVDPISMKLQDEGDADYTRFVRCSRCDKVIVRPRDRWGNFIFNDEEGISTGPTTGLFALQSFDQIVG